MNAEVEKAIVVLLGEIRKEFKRFNDREEAKQVKLPEGWTLNHCGKLIEMDLDIPVS